MFHIKRNESDINILADFNDLPKWLQGNDFLTSQHRPPLRSFRACFLSIFKLHTETINIWTHLLGFVTFIVIAGNFFARPSIEIDLEDKLIFGVVFLTTITCLGCSFVFHIVHCHSQFVQKFASKLDYCGISVLIMGSYVPWIHYSFYCHFVARVVYLLVVCALGAASVAASLCDKFAEPEWRPIRTAVFMTFGLSAIIPAVHYCNLEGWNDNLCGVFLMGVLYVVGAMLYALRVPERWLRGKCNVWFHSHQIFHVLVVGGALMNYYSIFEMAMQRITMPCKVHGIRIY